MNLTQRYHASRLSNSHVHFGRFVGVFVLLTVSIALSLGALVYLQGIGIWSSQPVLKTLRQLALISGSLAIIPSLAVLAAWSGYEVSGDG